MDVGLSPGDFVLDGTQSPPSPKRGRNPQFSAHVYCGETAAWINMPLVTEVGLGPDDSVLDGDPASLPKNGAKPPPQFSAHFYCGMKVDLSPGDFVLDVTQPLPKKGAEPPNFWHMFIVSKRLDGSRWYLA